MPLQAWSSARYEIPLPHGHRFPIVKYRMLRDRVVAEDLAVVSDPDAATVEDLQRVHTLRYIRAIVDGTLTAAEQRRIGFPWTPALVERSVRAVGGTCHAVAAALDDGVAMNLAGGTHHAFPDHGEGFCVFNDVAVAIRRELHHGRIQRAAVIDLDVHQGNGTHEIFANDPHVFTCSVHGERNYPFHKVAGDLDVELPDGTGDDDYLRAIAQLVPDVLARARPDLVVYLAGADPHEGDRLGRLRLSHQGLARRDYLVVAACREVGVPVAITIAGGYGHDIATTVEAHVGTVKVARAFA